MFISKRAIVTLTLYFIIIVTISSCSLNNLFGPEDPTPVVKKEWDPRLADTRWVFKKDSLLNDWVFWFKDNCSSISYENHLRDSLPPGPAYINMSWYSSNNSILHTDAEFVYGHQGSAAYSIHLKRDWNYSIRNDTILVVDSVEFVKIIKDTVQ